MLHVNDTVRHDPSLLTSWPEWARDYYGSRVGKVVEDEDDLRYVRVQWDKPAWYDATKSEALEWSGWLERVEG